ACHGSAADPYASQRAVERRKSFRDGSHSVDQRGAARAVRALKTLVVAMSEVPELTPVEVDRRWPAGRREGVVLLDVREHDELELAAIAGARHIPMRQVPARLEELPKDQPIVVFCHAGGRSRRVAQFLAANGFE